MKRARVSKQIKKELLRVDKVEDKAAGEVWNVLSKIYRSVINTKAKSSAEYELEFTFNVRDYVKNLQGKLQSVSRKGLSELIDFQHQRYGLDFNPSTWGEYINNESRRISAKLDTFTKEEANRIIDNVKSVIRDESDWRVAERKIKKRYRDIYNEVDKREIDKARNIVRTEINKMNNEAKLELGKREGAPRKGWINTGGNVRQTHIDAAVRYSSNPIPLNQKFKIGSDEMLQPCGGRLPEENVNCKCQMILIFN